jgi:hypothetical protein
MSAFLHISKLDAAKRQLELAIRLFFNYDDVVAIHTLSSAARDLLSDLAAKQGVKSIVYSQMIEEVVKPEKQAEVRKIFNKAKNFFKHADKDPDALLKFNPEISEFDIWDACELYRKLTQENTPLVLLYISWFYLKYNHLILDSERKEKALSLIKTFDPTNRGTFFSMLPDIEKVK